MKLLRWNQQSHTSLHHQWPWSTAVSPLMGSQDAVFGPIGFMTILNRSHFIMRIGKLLCYWTAGS